MCPTVWCCSVSTGCTGIQHGRAPVPEEGDWGQGWGDIFCWCYGPFWGEEEEKEEEREDDSCSALAFTAQDPEPRGWAHVTSMLAMEVFLWLNICDDVRWLGQSLSPPHVGITQHITPTQNGCLWDELSVVCWNVCIRTISGVPVKGTCFSSSRMLVRNWVDFSYGRDQLILTVLTQWSESSTWTAGETMPYPGKASGKILCCFDTCW